MQKNGYDRKNETDTEHAGKFVQSDQNMETETGASNQEDIGNRQAEGVSLRGISNRMMVVAKTAVRT